MKIIPYILLAFMSLACDSSRDAEVTTEKYKTPDGADLGEGPAPEGDHLVCCANGACSPAVDGECPEGKVLHQCSDEEVCNEDGSACWNECKLAE